jgi:hypothetical protein
MSTYHEEAGKGSHRRTEDRELIESNWDKIDWSKKVDKEEENSVAVDASE